MGERLHVGHRVRCTKLGPYNGAIGKVVSILGNGEAVSVEFRESTVTEKRNYFEKV